MLGKYWRGISPFRLDEGDSVVCERAREREISKRRTNTCLFQGRQVSFLLFFLSPSLSLSLPIKFSNFSFSFSLYLSLFLLVSSNLSIRFLSLSIHLLFLCNRSGQYIAFWIRICSNALRSHCSISFVRRLLSVDCFRSCD